MLIEIILINVRIVVTFYIIKKYRTYSESLKYCFISHLTVIYVFRYKNLAELKCHDDIFTLIYFYT